MDFSWFGTIPGMLITGGVLLLIISLIIFISTMGKKGKKDKNGVEEKSLEGAKEMVSESSQSNSVSAPVADAIPTGTDSITGMPNVAFATPTPVQPGVVSPMSGTVPVQPEVVQPMPETVPVQPEVVQPMPEVVSVSTEPTNQTVSIYGGASPSVSKSDIETTETHQIYGGANPLENTQSISINDINQAAASQIAAGNEPQIEQVVQPTPEVTTVINPTVSNVETQPQVSVVDVNQPIVEPYNPNNV